MPASRSRSGSRAAAQEGAAAKDRPRSRSRGGTPAPRVVCAVDSKEEERRKRRAARFGLSAEAEAASAEPGGETETPGGENDKVSTGNSATVTKAVAQATGLSDGKRSRTRSRSRGKTKNAQPDSDGLEDSRASVEQVEGGAGVGAEEVHRTDEAAVDIHADQPKSGDVDSQRSNSQAEKSKEEPGSDGVNGVGRTNFGRSEVPIVHQGSTQQSSSGEGAAEDKRHSRGPESVEPAWKKRLRESGGILADTAVKVGSDVVTAEKVEQPSHESSDSTSVPPPQDSSKASGLSESPAESFVGLQPLSGQIVLPNVGAIQASPPPPAVLPGLGAWRGPPPQLGGISPAGVGLPFPPMPNAPPQAARPPFSGHALLAQMSQPGALLPPTLPPVLIPEQTRVIVTVPIKIRASANLSLADLRKMLAARGMHSHQGQFHCKGDPEALEESACLHDLPDTRLLLSSEPDLKPWQLALVQRTAQQLIAARAAAGSGPVPFEAVLAQNPFYKTKLCNLWAQTAGRCIRGVRCLYAHGPAELRARPQVNAATFGALRPFLAPHMGHMPGHMPPPPGGLRPPGMLPRGMPGIPGMLGVPGVPGVPGLGTAPGVPGPPPGLPPSARPPAPEPEVRFTFNEEEEKKRAERAKRFAPRLASFELEEREAAAAESSTSAAAAEEAKAEAPPVEQAEQALPPPAGMPPSAGVPPPAGLPLPPEMPLDLDFGAEGMPAGFGEALSFGEDQIADYLLAMQQQFLSSLLPGEDDNEGMEELQGAHDPEALQAPALSAQAEDAAPIVEGAKDVAAVASEDAQASPLPDGASAACEASSANAAKAEGGESGGAPD